MNFRILFASVYVAIKFNEDEFSPLEYYARIAGISTADLSQIEGDFLDLIQFKLFVNPSQYDTYFNYLLHSEVTQTNVSN